MLEQEQYESALRLLGLYWTNRATTDPGNSLMRVVRRFGAFFSKAGAE